DADPEFLPDPLAQIDQPPAHDTINRRPLSIAAFSAARWVSFSFEGWPGALRSISPSGPWALNLITQSRTICNVTPPIAAASVRLAPSYTAASARRRDRKSVV